MAEFSEQISSRSARQDATGNKTGTREWYFDLPDQAAARSLFGTTPGSLGADSFPGEPSFRLDRIDTRIADNLAGVVVAASYSTNNAGRIPPRVRQQQPITREWGSRRIDTTIPINVQGKVTDDDGTAVDVWQQAELGDSQTHPERIYIVNVEGNYTMFDAASAQVGKLHKINGETLLFLDVATNQTEAGVWRATYRYVKDNGCIAQTSPPSWFLYVAPDNRAATGVDTYTGVNIALYWRLPFERLTQAQSSDPTVEPHPCISSRPEYVPDGYLTMPGGYLFRD